MQRYLKVALWLEICFVPHPLVCMFHLIWYRCSMTFPKYITRCHSCLCTCLYWSFCGSIACASGIPQSLVIACFRFISVWTTSGSLTFFRKVCSTFKPLILPSQFIIERNLQCISSGIPRVANGLAEGCTLIKLYHVCEGDPELCRTTDISKTYRLVRLGEIDCTRI